MANTSLSTILVILFWGLTLATGRKLSPLSTTTTTLSSSPTDGICSSMVKTQGYTCEEHLVTTQDGYILNLPRIRVGELRGPPVLLQHGLFMLLKDLCNNTGIDCTNLLTSFTVIREGTTSMFDYQNEDENIKHYGQPSPPEYDMTRIPNDLPLFLSYGGADALSDVKDVQRLLEILKDHQADKLVVQYRNDYAHADYVMGENAYRDVYEPLISFFRLQ
ncbi:hypothetical protein ACSQ67_017165 [Phaseolus vulgaris]